jgi:hypothetical protein
LQMRSALYSICMVLAVTAGCVTDDALYLQGESPGFGLGGVGGGDTDCRIGPAAPATADPTALPAAPSTVVTYRRGAQPPGGDLATVGFNTSCDSWITE